MKNILIVLSENENDIKKIIAREKKIIMIPDMKSVLFLV